MHAQRARSMGLPLVVMRGSPRLCVLAPAGSPSASGQEGITYDVHFSEAEAQRLAAFIAERIEINALQSLR